jgi:hypothetical protein
MLQDIKGRRGLSQMSRIINVITLLSALVDKSITYSEVYIYIRLDTTNSTIVSNYK